MYRLRRFREVLDEEFPTIRKKAKKARRERSNGEKRRDFLKLMARRRYTEILYDIGYALGMTVEAGVPTYRCPVKGEHYWPVWFMVMVERGNSRMAMRKMLKSRKGQLQLETEWRLSEEPEGKHHGF